MRKLKDLSLEEAPEQQKASEAYKKTANSGQAASGGFAAVLAVVFLAVILVLNLIIASVPSRFSSFDLSEQKLYSIGDTTKELLDSLDEEVTLYFLTESGQEDLPVSHLLESYAGYSDKVKLERIDIVTQPTFASAYTDQEVPLNSVIAAAGERSAVASYSEFYLYDSTYSTAYAFDAEGRITSAIAKAAIGSGAVVYYTAGHSEVGISSEMQDSMSKAGIEAREINLLSQEIPEDCQALILFSPMQDLTSEEADKVIAYLGDGGHALIVSSSDAVTADKTPNFDRILAAYGITRLGGLAMEGDTSSYIQTPYILIPHVNEMESTQGLSGQNIVCALPEAIGISEDEDDLSYTANPILTTGPDGYVKQKLTDTLAKEDGDLSGTFNLAVQIEENLSYDSQGSPDAVLPESEGGKSADQAGTDGTDPKAVPKRTKILYFTTPCLFSSDALSTLIQQSSALPEGNTALFAKAMSYLTDSSVSISVEPRDLGVPQTTVSTGFQQIWGNVLMILLPLAVLIAGGVIYIRRRRR